MKMVDEAGMVPALGGASHLPLLLIRLAQQHQVCHLGFSGRVAGFPTGQGDNILGLFTTHGYAPWAGNEASLRR
jgi:hypothetical protein